MSSLPYLTAAQQKLLLQNFRDGDDQGLRHAPPTATTVDATSARADHVCTSARAEMRLDSPWLARIWVSDW